MEKLLFNTCNGLIIVYNRLTLYGLIKMLIIETFVATDEQIELVKIRKGLKLVLLNMRLNNLENTFMFKSLDEMQYKMKQQINMLPQKRVFIVG